MKRIKRDHSKKQDNFIKEVKYRWVTTESQRRKTVYEKILSCIDFF